jgi:hypothetical protein
VYTKSTTYKRHVNKTGERAILEENKRKQKNPPPLVVQLLHRTLVIKSVTLEIHRVTFGGGGSKLHDTYRDTCEYGKTESETACTRSRRNNIVIISACSLNLLVYISLYSPIRSLLLYRCKSMCKRLQYRRHRDGARHNGECCIVRFLLQREFDRLRRYVTLRGEKERSSLSRSISNQQQQRRRQQRQGR